MEIIGLLKIKYEIYIYFQSCIILFLFDFLWFVFDKILMVYLGNFFFLEIYVVVQFVVQNFVVLLFQMF